MKVNHLFQKLNGAIDAWFKQPEPNAAGSMGLFRILYALFYLWRLSYHSADFLSGMPSFFVEQEVYIVKYIFPDFGASFPPSVFHFFEALLVAALVLLAFGYKTRWATISVFVLGCFLEALSTAIDGKRTLIPLVFYIPLFMSIFNAWGHTYSVDAALKKKSGETPVDPHDSHWQYFLPSRALLVIFSVLFLNSGIFKVAFGGAWLSHSDMMANFFLNRNVEATIYGLPLNGLAPFLSQHPLLYLPVHASTLIFEFGFCLSLISRKLRNIIVSLALIFHAVNALWLVVTVTPILVGYFAFIDWQAIRDLVVPSSQSKAVISPKILVFLSLFCAVLLGVLWHSDVGIRTVFNLNGWVDWRTIWYPVLPVATVGLVISVLRLRQPATKQA